MTDRNDRNYFKKITPEFVASMFEGYSVPENIKERVSLIMRRFTIFGLSDGMYIANSIALGNGTGDGCGNFEDGEIAEPNIGKIVKSLMGAYGCNIFSEDKEDLTEIIRTGSMEKKRMIRGLESSIRNRRGTIRKIRSKCVKGDPCFVGQFGLDYQKATKEAEIEADNWRIEFLYGEINVIRDTILMEKAG